MRTTRRSIAERLGRPDAVEHITGVVATHPQLNRTELAEGLCERYGFFDERGAARANACMHALRKLRGRGLITLPPKGSSRGNDYREGRLWEPVAPPRDVPERVDLLTELTLVPVDSDELKRLYNELIAGEHPLRHGWTAGRRMRYLVRSEHGWLGAVGFGAAALRLADRDAWIGWNEPQRREHLQRVLSMDRFLIRPSVRCTNLASRVLGIAVARVGDDFQHTYGVRPWLLESFVDRSQYAGTCYRAANWQCVGRSRGRGRDDRDHTAEKSIKDIYVYPLEDDFRALMGLARDAGAGPLFVADEPEVANWAEQEFGGAQFGDKRLTRRLVKIAADKGASPGRSYSKSAGGNWADTMGYYRFVEHEDPEAITMDSILAPHAAMTVRRARTCDTVLCIQDTTDLDQSANRDCEGLGVTGCNQTGTKSRGLRLHSVLATDGNGVPLGILHADCYAPELKPERRGKDHRYIPVEEKETYRWIEGQKQIARIARDELPSVRVISITDREGDFFEHFHSWEPDSGVHLLVRAKNNRAVHVEAEDDGDDEAARKMFAAVAETPVRSTMRIHISRRSARPKQGRRKAREARRERDARVEVRYMPVDIRPPAHGLSSRKPPVPVWLVHVREIDPPENADAVDWRLLTTLPIDSPADAERCVRWYCRRWRIEDWHRVLKSGCRTEACRLKTAERIKRAVAIDMVAAWRIMLMVLLGREAPDLPAEVIFTELEVAILGLVAEKRGSHHLRPSTAPSRQSPPSAAASAVAPTGRPAT